MRTLQIAPVRDWGRANTAGGKTKLVWSLVRHLAETGDRVCVATPYEKVPFERDGNITVASFGLSDGARHSMPNFAMLTQGLRAIDTRDVRIAYHYGRRLNELLNRSSPDVVHIHFSTTSIPFALRLFKNAHPLILSCISWHYLEALVESNSPEVDRYRRLAQLSLNLADRVTVIARHNLYAAKKLGLVMPQVDVIQPPVSEIDFPPMTQGAARSQLGLSPAQKVVTCCAFIGEPRKNIPMLLEAMAKLNRSNIRDWTLVVVGRGSPDEEHALARRAVELDIDLRLFVNAPNGVLNAAYHAADVFALPSAYEGWGIAYVESLVAGTPVVGFGPTVSELATELGLDVGAAFDPLQETAHALAERIRCVAERSLDRCALRKLTLARFGEREALARYRKIYQETLASKKTMTRAANVASS
jgi:glycosyltransferase involved in cell wall biosynthesis